MDVGLFDWGLKCLPSFVGIGLLDWGLKCLPPFMGIGLFDWGLKYLPLLPWCLGLQASCGLNCLGGQRWDCDVTAAECPLCLRASVP